MQSKKRDGSTVPDPWEHLGEYLPDVVLVRERIAEPGRYYDEHRAIVLRRGLRIEQERRYLWHEIVHAVRRDRRCEGWLRAKVERSVEREAMQRAMPFVAVEAQLAQAATWQDFVWQMKVPEPWVVERLHIAHPAEVELWRRACRWSLAEWVA